jgi:hypothetical protein
MANVAPYILIVWVLIVIGLFPAFPKHRAILVAFLLGLHLLPEVGSPGGASSGVLPLAIGPLRFSKDNAMSYAVFLAAFLFDSKRLLAGRPRWFDVPMVVWCLCPLASALTNAPPPDGSWAVRDGLSQALQQTAAWGIPYLLGRVYFTDSRALRDLALGSVLAAVAYIPLCLYEVRMSPQLHRLVYGYTQHTFAQTIRFDGYRPMVFFMHGLTLALWMVCALLIAGWLWWSGKSAPGRRTPSKIEARMGWFALLLLPTVVLLKSTGALVLGVVGWGILCAARCRPSRVWLLLLVAIPPLYVITRTSGAWKGESIVEMAKANLGNARAQSLEFRLENEERLIDKALRQPLFGWGGWGRARVYDDEGKDRTTTDGLWIIALGDRGVVGLVALGGVLLLPVLRFAFLFPPRRWGEPLVAPLTACAVVAALFAIDCLLNAGFNHIYLLMAGGLVGLSPGRQPEDRAREAPARRFRLRPRPPLTQEVPRTSREAFLAAGLAGPLCGGAK